MTFSEALPFKQDGQHLHLASTPRHILSAYAIAANFPNAVHRLVIFDQPNVENDFLDVVIKHLEKKKLFSDFTVLYKNSGAKKDKAKHRKSTFKTLALFTKEYEPQVIYVGNDRRVEFQYLAHLFAGKTHNVYVDEGTGSYNNFFGIRLIKNLFDKFIDTKIKKIVYGSWYCRPNVLGESHWIHSSILCFPELANYALTNKPITKFLASWTFHSSVKELLEQYAQSLNFDISIFSNINTLFILPHDSFMQSDEFDVTAYRTQIINNSKQTEKIVGIKYHPRQIGDPLKLKQTNIIEIPRQLPLEIFLPLLNVQTVFGDLSSALLSMKWANNDSKVIAKKYNDSPAVNHLMDMFEKVGIEIL